MCWSEQTPACSRSCSLSWRGLGKAGAVLRSHAGHSVAAHAQGGRVAGAASGRRCLKRPAGQNWQGVQESRRGLVQPAQAAKISETSQGNSSSWRRRDVGGASKPFWKIKWRPVCDVSHVLLSARVGRPPPSDDSPASALPHGRRGRKLALWAGTPVRAHVGLAGRTPCPPHARAPSGVCVPDAIV